MSKYQKKLWVMFIALFLVLSTTVSVFSFVAYQAEIDEDIPLDEGGIRKVLVKVNWNPDLEPIKFNHDAVVAELKAEAAATQAPLIAYLGQKPDAKVINTFWLSNLILVEADVTTIREMATFTGVSKIMSVFTVSVLGQKGKPPEEVTIAQGDASWNILKVRAPDVWQNLGITGEGVRFATTDTGIHLAHPDLAGTLYSDNYNDPTYPGGWIEFDGNGAIVPGSVPHDTSGHGTATYGLIVGDAAGPYGAIGMAPGAAGQGMHALNLPGGSGTFPQVIAGLQWVIDPVDQYGNPAGEWARVSSHSWGASGHYNELIEPIENMYMSGHFVVAAMGNEGEGSTRSPGNVWRAFGAGATDINDYVPSWSSGNVEDWPESYPEPYIKPDASAPGDFPVIPYPPDTYSTSWYGTSFSSPHIGGAAVLMLSGNPSLNPDEIGETLEETGVWYNYYYPERPDTRYGWGRIDAYEAVMMVALPQGVRGYVTDAISHDPISQVKVYAVEADRSVETDEDGYYDLRLVPGPYTLVFSRFGYEDAFRGVAITPNVFTWLSLELTPVPPGYIAGTVYYQDTMIGIPGATVEVLDVPVTITAETDVTGAYTLAIPPGQYDLEASAYGFKSDPEENVDVYEGMTTTVNFYLTQPPKVAVVGDYLSKVTNYLKAEGYDAYEYATFAAVNPVVQNYGAIIVNRPTTGTSADFASFVAKTDANKIGVLWLDSWASYTGGYWLYYYLKSPRWPPYRYTHYSSSIQYTYYKIVYATDTDLFDPSWGMNYIIKHDMGVGTDHDHAYYTGVVDGWLSGVGTVKRLTNVGDKYPTYFSDHANSQGIIKVTRDTGNKWVLLSMHANTPWTMVDYWHDDTKLVFKNAINWVSPPAVPHAKIVVFGLDVVPETGLWSDVRTVSVGVKNVGGVAGSETIEMYVDTILEGSEVVSLGSGDYTYLSWQVSRFDVGTYTAKVKYLSKTFRVRPPQINLQAYEYGSPPLAGADVYGYYQTYTGPGYFTQWSQTYGGYGHSQHAQPVGDIDEDGVNEIIIGGYENSPNWGRARIMSYDTGSGTYIQEHEWYEPGGSYHSPSGSTVVDLDEDGDLEFVVSWSYSGSDGIYAYDWDGTTLYSLGKYNAGFIFDVYSADYDDDGHIEVLIANAPQIASTHPKPWHVAAFTWVPGTGFVVEATWTLSGYEYMENPMLWSGDTDNDGKTEIITCLSSGDASTQGTWALNWDSMSGQWIAQQVYAGLINGGTHYGVVVGDVDGDGTPEIGIGNNVAGYVGAGAVLIEWDGDSYEKVWEKSWPSEYAVIEALAIGDADNDGKNEFVAGGGYVHVIGSTANNYYVEEATITATQGLLAGTIIGDMDSDGLNEIKSCDIVGMGPGKEWIFKYTAAGAPTNVWNFKYFGTTDANGQLVFDSPASIVDMYLFVYKGDKTPLGWQYLLAKYLDRWRADGQVTYAPTYSTEARVVSKPNSRALELFPHVGVTWLLYNGIPVIWPFTSYKTDPTAIVVTPQTYQFRHMLNIIDPYGSWWYYFMYPDRIATLSGGKKYEYQFAGQIQGSIDSTQNGQNVQIDWTATDGFGHQITGISVDEANWLTSGTTTYVPVPIEPSMLQDVEVLVGETVDYYPLLTLYDSKKNIIASGYVEWDEKHVQTTVTKTVASEVLSFVSGPYGNPNARMYVTVIT